MKLYVKWMMVIPYAYIYEHFAIYRANPDNMFDWMLAVLAVDMAYYWFHREAHMINLFWASHSAHHSSEEYNFSTALRQAMLGHFVDPIFYLPLALVFPPKLYEFHSSVNTIYQFWVHTELVGKMHPAVEFIFNTPSHHRVHHARNPEYLDKNFGGMLIIWDRLFGTFEPEKTKAVYGLVHPLNTWGNIWAQIHHFVYVLQCIWNTPGIANKVLVTFYPPGWSVDKTGEWIAPEIPALDPKHKKFDPQIPQRLSVYMLLQFAGTAIIYIIYSLIISQVTWFDALLGAVYLFLCLEVYGFVLEGHRFGLRLEIIRLSITFLLALRFSFYSVGNTALWTWIAFSFVSSFWCFALRKDFGACVAPKTVKTK
eukprot:Phypoly_transcript_11597.p1 GENE.Phypoly_transcript_11597~~Phypoly_transcript_11597.p1  ORF type:complete len:396 (+),score=39.39 Phypoly_transcript_11597:86-1189(+)